jgi:hypothetical protein
MPVRDTIQSSEIPSDAASAALVSRPADSSVANARIAAVRGATIVREAGESRVGTVASGGSDHSSN